MNEDRQRVDRWLWHARVVRTRSAAVALAVSGHVRLNGTRIDAASRPVKLGDVLTVALDRRVRVLKVIAFAPHRGSATDAQELFVELTEPAAGTHEGGPQAKSAARDPGTGRPTKRERRLINRLTNHLAIRDDT